MNTQIFDEFHKSSRLSEVRTAVARRFQLKVNECILLHKGKILSIGSKVLLDYDIEWGDTILLYKRCESSPPPVDTPSANSDVEDGQIEITPNSTDTEETACPECGLAEAGSQNVFCEECHNWWHWYLLSQPA